MQGFKATLSGEAVDMGLGPVAGAFPDRRFPTGAVHELLSDTAEQAAATCGFMAGLLSHLMQQEGACIWITASPMIFPPALQAFGILPERLIFITLQKEKEVLWAMEEALKCEGLAAVVGELKELDFTASRRLQLAVSQSRVTGFVWRHQPRQVQPTACVSRWRITPLASETENGWPGVGWSRWQVSLLKIRNGKPGSWPVEWTAKGFVTGVRGVYRMEQEVQKRKRG